MKVAATVTALGLMLFLAGCSDSGASKPTTVTIKPKSSGSGEASNGKSVEPTGNGGAAAEGFGTLKGRVVLEGSPPQLALLVRKGSNIKDAPVCAAQDVPNEKLVVGANNGVANVFVYLSKAPAGAQIPEPSKDPVLFDQKGCRFFPHALFIRVGTPLQVVSSDNVTHNTKIETKRGTPFNSPIQPNDRVGATTTFTTYEPAPISVKCDFHGWMSAYQLPLEHPFAAVTNENGEFEIAGLPVGTHRFKVWHEGAEFLSNNLAVTIEADKTTETTIPYPVDKFKP